MSQRPCLIVGASGNIGEEIAVRLRESGRRVALTHSLSSFPSERISADAPQVRWYGVDVCDSTSVKRVIGQVQEDFGQIPDLVYSAGIVKDGSIALVPDDVWDSVIQTNLTGAFYFIRSLAKDLMVAGNGRIVLIGSVSATKGNPGQLSYSAAKGGLESMCRVVAAELGRFGVTCNVISPGAIESRMVKGTPTPAVERLLKNTPLRQFGKPDDVAGLVDFLLSRDGRYITGQTIQIDGGMTAM